MRPDGEPAEVALEGGNMTAVFRVGDTVRRAAGPWTPTIHQLWADLQEIHMRIKPDFDPTTPEARAAWDAQQAADAAA